MKNCVLDVSYVWIIYPWYHPLRPKFFNMATLFADTINFIHFGIYKHVEKKYKIKTFTTGLEWNSQIAYENYDTWFKSNKDKQIGANYLRNRQLVWVAAAFLHYVKRNKRVPIDIDPSQRVRDDFLNVNFKINQGFQEAFDCEFNDKEIDEWYEYLKKFKVAKLNVDKNE